MKKAMLAYLNAFFGKDLELRVRLFHVLAITGFLICVVMTAVSIAGGMWASAVINFGAGVVSLGLLLYSAKSRRYQLCYFISILVIFLILFPSLFFSGGGYQGGMCFFFVFAVVFTVYMLDGWAMLAVTVLEMIFYSVLCVIAYRRPDLVVAFDSEAAVLADIIIGQITVSISLGATMFVQVRMYQRQQQELETAQKKAESASQAKSAFLASMSHEIRTPIHMILGMNEIIHRESRSQQIRDYSEKIDDTSKMLLSLVDSVLDVSKIESGKMELIPAPYDTENLVRILSLIGKTYCKKKNLHFLCEISETLPNRLYGDLAHIRQIAANFLSNAAKYTENGTVTLKVTGESSTDPEQILLCISVQDTGIGLHKEAIPTLFDAFTRADLASHRYIEGTGLGLKIVKELCDLMGGTVSVTSKPGKGSTFTAKLPQKILKEDPEAETSQTVIFQAPGCRILTVDDNEGNRMVMQELLSPTKMTVDTASSGAECLRMVQEHAYQLILMDYMMPEMNGLETLQHLKENSNFHTPVIAMTADATAETKQRLTEGGFSALLTKPVPWAKLRDTLLAFLPGEMITESAAETLNSISDSRDQELIQQMLPYGIVLEEALPYFENSMSDYAVMAGLFLRHHAQEQKKIRFLVDSKDWTHLRFPVHALKGKAKNLGLLRLSELCAYVEKLCAAGDPAEISSLIPHLFYLWQRGRDGLELLVRQRTPAEPPQEPSVPAGQCLEQLPGLLEEFRRRPALECVRRLIAEEASPEGKQLLQEVEAQVNAIAFEKASAAFAAYLTWKNGGTQA